MTSDDASDQPEMASPTMRELVAGAAGPRLAALGSLVSALGLASCCVIPLTLVSAGIGGTWFGGLFALAPYRPYFLVASLALIGGGFVMLLGRRKRNCETGACIQARPDRIAQVGLLSAAVLVVLALTVV